MICQNDTCKSNKVGQCKFPKTNLTLDQSGTCISLEPISQTCATCGNMKKDGYKLMCHGWGEPRPDETYAEKTCGAWKRRASA